RENNIAVLSGGSGLYIDAVSKGFDVLPKVVPGLRKDLEEELNTKGLDLLVTELLQKDPEYGNEVDLKNPQRILRALEIIRSSGEKFSALRKREIKPRPFLTIKIGLNRERDELYRRIDKRMDIMLETGLLEEAKKYVNFRNCNALKTVGYKEIYHYLDKEYDWDEAVRLLKRNTRRIAKRQLTWFRKDAEITWFHPSQEKEIINHIDKHIGKTN
ncbi:MAG: tRNA (adenosine(37)-N6)-dimethylallyltransferase MiaA, partial [Bacteroidota bacterium]